MDNGDQVMVMGPFPGSPAWKADLRRGDWIVGRGRQGHHRHGVRPTWRTCCAARAAPRCASRVKREGATDVYTAEVTRGEIETSIVDAFWVKPGYRLPARG